MIEVELPDGTIAEFPEGTPDEVIKGALQKQFGSQPAAAPETTQAPEAGWGETILDVGASALSGAGRGIADLAGLPGTIGDAVNSGLSWVTGLPELPKSPLSGSTLRGGLSTVTGGASDYQPETTAGEYARTVGEFAPGAVAFGGTGLANVARNLVAPAVTSETAGQLTEGTEAEPYARIVGALAGGMGANALARSPQAKLPTAKEIKQAAGYQQLEAPMKAATLTKPTYQSIVRDLMDEAEGFGLTTKLKGEFGGVLRDFTKRADTSGASLYDLELLRRSLRNAAGDKLDNASQALSARLVERLDDAVETLSAANIAASGSTGKPVLDALKEAREGWRVGAKSQVIETAMERAQNAASGFENGLRVEFRKILNNQKSARQFSQVEREAMEKVVRGDLKSNALRWFGGFGVPVDNGRNFLGSVMGGSVGAGLGSMLGPAGAAIGGPALVGAGTLAKLGANAATRNQASVVEALVKGGPAAAQNFSQAQSAAQVAGREAVLRALLQSTQASQVPQYVAVPPR